MQGNTPRIELALAGAARHAGTLDLVFDQSAFPRESHRILVRCVIQMASSYAN